jgi:molybdopterin biosynthesis enzyme MoaB
VTLKHTNPFNESVDPNSLSYLGYRFILPSAASHQVAYVYNEAVIFCFSGKTIIILN